MSVLSPVPSASSALPDVANETGLAVKGRLDWVGMGAIHAPVTLAGEDGQPVRFPARIDAAVDLQRGDVRGIHMSRLYLHLDRALGADVLTPAALRRLLALFLESQGGLANRAKVGIHFEYLARRAALISDNSGWKAYPVSITGVLEDGHFQLELGLQILYSSTCPCSAALARQLIQQRFREDFAGDGTVNAASVLAWLGTEQGINATPHSQRSAADIKVRLNPAFDQFPIIALIDRVEQALGTPVQTAGKREDEQAFAHLNGNNLMFCEDAARRIQSALDSAEQVADFWLRVSPYESLHPHDAVAEASKGIAGGYRGGANSVGGGV